MISLFDSGIGGLSVLKELYKAAPNEDYTYFADNAYCPYGEKSPEFIIERATEISRTLISAGADIIVVACNTATAAAITTLRKQFGIPFIGMEPAVKPAALGSKSGKVGVLATAGTFKGSLYRHTSGLYKGYADIIERVGEGLVELVESGRLEGPETEARIRRCITPMLEAGADHIVLGCTHYPFLKEAIRKCAPGITIVNPAPAVARHTLEVLKERGYSFSKGPGHGKTVLLSSGDPEILRKTAASIQKECLG